jgi:hypothetical protein
MTLQVRNAAVDPDTGQYSLDGYDLGAPGDDGAGAVLLAELDLDSTVGSDAFEITASEDVIATVAGRNYAVAFATVRRAGKLDDKIAIIGVPVDYAPGDNNPPPRDDEVV